MNGSEYKKEFLAILGEEVTRARLLAAEEREAHPDLRPTHEDVRGILERMQLRLAALDPEDKLEVLDFDRSNGVPKTTDPPKEPGVRFRGYATVLVPADHIQRGFGGDILGCEHVGNYTLKLVVALKQSDSKVWLELPQCLLYSDSRKTQDVIKLRDCSRVALTRMVVSLLLDSEHCYDASTDKWYPIPGSLLR